MRVTERLPEDEHGALHRGQRLQDDEYREGDGVGEDGALHGVGDGVPEVGDVGLGQPRAYVGLATRLDLAESVDREAGGDAYQVGARFADLGMVGGGPAQPGLLDHVLGVGHPPEHAVGDPHEDGAVLFEDIGRGVGGHHLIPRVGSRAVQQKPVGPQGPRHLGLPVSSSC